MRAVLVPGVLALLPEYAGLTDPVAELRAACEEAVAWAAQDGPVSVLGTAQGRRVAAALLGSRGLETVSDAPPRPPLVVVGNGSARRRDTSPGYVDDRAPAFDAALGAALARGELAGCDLSLSGELWADTDAIAQLAGLLPAGCPARIDYDDDPFGVQYWVARWEW